MFILAKLTVNIFGCSKSFNAFSRVDKIFGNFIIYINYNLFIFFRNSKKKSISRVSITSLVKFLICIFKSNLSVHIPKKNKY